MTFLCCFLWNLLFCPLWTFCPWPHFFFQDWLGCIPQCNPLKLGHTLDIANIYRGMHAAQREVGVPLGSFTQTQSCTQLRLTRPATHVASFDEPSLDPHHSCSLKRQTHVSHTVCLPSINHVKFNFIPVNHPIHSTLLVAPPVWLI